MRLTGGLDRGRRLIAPRGGRTRPTASRVREAIFNILGPPPDGRVLDLYAGSGALGIEALSRGSGAAVFVEREHAALVALRRNLREVGLEDRSTVIAADVCSALRRLAGRGDRFCWVFLDPPYARETEGVLAELSGTDLLTPCAVVVVEHDSRHRPPASVGELFLTDRRQYGDTELSFYRCSRS
jgi:16S rRNA (guanine(966)-N(2))-methyltransferase RsmD